MNLSTLYAQLSADEREALAARADTDAGYLWQLATRWRGKKPSLDFIKKLAEADSRLTLVELVDEFAASDAPAIVTPTYTGPDRRKARA